MDRIDLRVAVRQLSQEELLKAPDGESSETIRARVVAARQRQFQRYSEYGIFSNSQLDARLLQKFCTLSKSGEILMKEAVVRWKLSPRAYSRILKVARSIADLAGSEILSDEHLFEAINYRKTDIEL